MPFGKVDIYLENLTVLENEIIMKEAKVAEKFARDFIKTNREVWANPLETAIYHILAEAIRIALEEKILKEEDLFKEDKFVFKKLKESKNLKIVKNIEILSPKLRIEENPSDYDFYIKTKPRFIDPKCFHEGKLLRVSEISNGFKKYLEEQKVIMGKGHYIKIIRS